MKKHANSCDCDQCFRSAVMDGVDRWIEKTVKDNPGVVCPFCGTNPSKPAPHSSGWKAWCGHEVRVKGLVIGWRKKGEREIIKCVNPDKTRELVHNGKKWVEQEVK